MAFISLFFILLLWPVWLLMIALAFILPWLGFALSAVAWFLFACNMAFLVLLIFIRTKWKSTGRMDRNFIDSYEGWRRFGLQAVKALLTGGVIWETIVTAGCALLLIFQPWNALLP